MSAYPPYFLGCSCSRLKRSAPSSNSSLVRMPARLQDSESSPGPHSAVDRTWDYSVVHEPFEGDVVIEDGRARVFVDSDAAKELENAVLDANVDEHTLEPRFIVRTRNAS